MTEQECLEKMVAPGTPREGKYRRGVIQIWVTRACDKQCFGCTQGSQLGGNPGMITVEQFEQAVVSLKGYFGVVGMFGGNPAMHPQFSDLCAVLRRHIPWEQRGLWCNNPISQAKAESMRATFNPAVSNLNVHLDVAAFNMFREHWPESRPFGLVKDSRHSPCYVAMKDVLKKDCPNCAGEGYNSCSVDSERFPCPTCNTTGQVYDEEKAWELISSCDINQHWSAMVGVFRGEVRAWFCEIAGAQAMLHQHEPDYPDTGLKLNVDYYGWEWSGKGAKTPGPIPWWELPMSVFSEQVRKHCHDCGVPLRGYGELACSTSDFSQEQVSETHQSVFKTKDKNRRVQLVTVPGQLQPGRIDKTTHYLQNSEK